MPKEVRQCRSETKRSIRLSAASIEGRDRDRNTRWGTQARAINSLYQNKDAFKLSLLDSRTSINNTVIDLLGSPLFWHQVEELRDLILPIYQHQIFSESENLHLGKIVHWWLEIRRHLMGISQQASQLGPSQLFEIFD